MKSFDFTVSPYQFLPLLSRACFASLCPGSLDTTISLSPVPEPQLRAWPSPHAAAAPWSRALPSPSAPPPPAAPLALFSGNPQRRLIRRPLDVTLKSIGVDSYGKYKVIKISTVTIHSDYIIIL